MAQGQLVVQRIVREDTMLIGGLDPGASGSLVACEDLAGNYGESIESTKFRRDP